MERARVVVIGGGVTGCSVAYHLAKAGWTDVLLLEKAELTSGSTFHAAGLVTSFNPSPTMMRFRRYSIDLYRELGVFETVGSLRLASSRAQFQELQRGVSRAKGIGLEVDLVSAAEVLRLMPAATPDELYGAVWVPGDGHLDPHTATHALAKAAMALGVRVRTGVRVIRIELDARRAVTAVQTEEGPIETEVVVNAAGIWAAQVAAMVGGRVPSTPVDHQHVALRAVPGSELPADMPCFRDPDNLVYGKSEAGGVLFGGYEPDPVARWVDGVPWEHGGRSLPPALDRFEQLLEGAARRFPFVAGAEIVKLVCHPDAMTPDANPLLGPIPGVRGFFMAAGLSLNGFGGAGGIGRSIAEWVTEGDTELDMTAYRAWRFGPVHADPSFAAEQSREAYRYYYLLRYPLDQDEWGRPKRVSPLHHRMQELGGVFGTKAGWERPIRFHPGSPWRRAGAEQRAFGWTRPPWFDVVGEEHRAVRERVGMFDLSSFGKIEVAGPDALALLGHVSANRIDREPGRLVYTQFLNDRGGIVADVTVARLNDESFRVVTGAGTAAADLGWLRANTPHSARVTIRDLTEELAVIGVWGPRAREVVAAVTDDDVSNEGFRFFTARTIGIAGAEVWAQRLTYVGELGWELFVEPDAAVQVWDRLWAAGDAHGARAAGYEALDHLRIEKGYRYFGTDLTPLDTPFETGLAALVDLEGGDFRGRNALRAVAGTPPAHALRTLLIGENEAYLPIYGGEAVLDGERVIGRLRSCAYGYTARHNVAFASLPASVDVGTTLHVEVFGQLVLTEVAADVLHDPEGARIRA